MAIYFEKKCYCGKTTVPTKHFILKLIHIRLRFIRKNVIVFENVGKTDENENG